MPQFIGSTKSHLKKIRVQRKVRFARATLCRNTVFMQMAFRSAAADDVVRERVMQVGGKTVKKA